MTLFTLAFPLIIQLMHPSAQAGDLLRQLGSNNPNTRRAAIVGLIRLGSKLPKEAILPLTKAILDSDPDVRYSAVMACRSVGMNSPEVMENLVKVHSLDLGTSTSWQAELTLKAIGKPAVKAVAGSLGKERNVASRLAMYGVLGDIGPDAKEAVYVLERGLTADDTLERLIAAKAIVLIDPTNKKIGPPLSLELDSPVNARRLIAAESLARSSFSKTKKTLAVLLEFLKSEKAPLRDIDRAAIALSRFGSDGKMALPTLVGIFEKHRKSDPANVICIAGAIIIIDRSNTDARSFLHENLSLIAEMALPENDRTIAEFCRDLAANRLKND